MREEANHKKKDSKKIHFNANFKVTPSLVLALIVERELARQHLHIIFHGHLNNVIDNIKHIILQINNTKI